MDGRRQWRWNVRESLRGSRSRWHAGVAAALVAGVLVTAPLAGWSQTGPAPTTPTLTKPLFSFTSKLAGIPDQSWFLKEIPFIDLPTGSGPDSGQQIQQVYYYRWEVVRDQLHYGGPQRGYYVGINQGLTAPEGPSSYLDLRWMRERGLVERDLQVNAFGGPSRYSDAYAWDAYQYALVTGNLKPLVAALPGFLSYYQSWAPYFDAKVGLYWHQPVWDATEHTVAGDMTNFNVPGNVDFTNPSSFLNSLNTFFGGWGYTVPLNTYQAADAQVIADLATAAGDTKLAQEYAAKSQSLVANMDKYLWSPALHFYVEVLKDSSEQGYYNADGQINPPMTQLQAREIFGYLPWEYDLAPDTADYASAWSQLLDPQGFGTAFGPTTSEMRSRYTLQPGTYYEADKFDGNCCHWDGPNWPYSTARTLVALSNLLDDYHNLGSPAPVTSADYFSELQRFARLQYLNGKPYVAEAADPITGKWIYNQQNYSDNYNQYSYVNLVLNGLLGIRPELGNTLEIKPLVPASWAWFAVQNVPYHGHTLSVVWDKTGQHYGVGQGLSVFEDGKLIGHQSGLGPLTLTTNPVVSATLPAETTGTMVNWAANPSIAANAADSADNAYNTTIPYPAITASYNGPGDGALTGNTTLWSVGGHLTDPSRRNEIPANVIDGQVILDPSLPYSRWTNQGSPNTQDWLAVDFGQPRPVDDIRLYLYKGTNVGLPTGFTVQYSTDGSTWQAIPGAVYPKTLVGNAPNDVTFPQLTARYIRVLFPQKQTEGVLQLEAWGPDNPSPTNVDPTDNCPAPQAGAQLYLAADGFVDQGTVAGSDYTCGYDYVGQLNTGSSYFLSGLNTTTPGDLANATAGPLFQGFTGISSVNFTVHVPTAGTYTMNLEAANGLSGQPATAGLTVNGSAQPDIAIPYTGGWSDTPQGPHTFTTTVSLHAGTNTITVSKGTNYAEIDYIELIPSS